MTETIINSRFRVFHDIHRRYCPEWCCFDAVTGKDKFFETEKEATEYMESRKAKLFKKLESDK